MRYDNIPVLLSPSGNRAYRNIRYPDIPLTENDIYLYATDYDRLDTLALRFYNDQSLWWVISIANPVIDMFTIFPPTEKRIRIPANINAILGEYDRINNTTLELDYNVNITRNNSGGRSNLLQQRSNNGSPVPGNGGAGGLQPSAFQLQTPIGGAQ